MARLKLILARALVLYVALLPLFGMPAEAQDRQLIKPPLPDPLPERPVPARSRQRKRTWPRSEERTRLLAIAILWV